MSRNADKRNVSPSIKRNPWRNDAKVSLVFVESQAILDDVG